MRIVSIAPTALQAANDARRSPCEFCIRHERSSSAAACGNFYGWPCDTDADGVWRNMPNGCNA